MSNDTIEDRSVFLTSAFRSISKSLESILFIGTILFYYMGYLILTNNTSIFSGFLNGWHVTILFIILYLAAEEYIRKYIYSVRDFFKLNSYDLKRNKEGLKIGEKEIGTPEILYEKNIMGDTWIIKLDKELESGSNIILLVRNKDRFDRSLVVTKL